MLDLLDIVQGYSDPDAALSPERAGFREVADEISCEPPRLKVLVVEDDAGDYAAIEHCLGHMTRYEAQIVLAGNLAAARFAIRADELDLVLVDYHVRGACGIDLLADVARIQVGCPCVLLCGLPTSEIEVEALKMGAVACIAKGDLSPKVLETIVRQSLRERAMQQALQALTKAGLMLRDGDAARAGGFDARASVRPMPAKLVAGRCDDQIFDVQALVVDAVGRARQRRGADGVGHAAINLNLLDRPAYVRADERAALRQLDAALAELEGRQLTVSVEQAGVWSEIVIEHTTFRLIEGSCNWPGGAGDDGSVVYFRRAKCRPPERTSILLPAAERPCFGG